MILFIKYAILVFAVGATMFSRRWGLAVFAFFLPLTQWMPETHLTGVNALNLMLLPILIRAIIAGPEPEPSRGPDPILVPAAIIVAFVTFSWARVQFSSALPPAFLEARGLYGNFVTFKEILLGIVMYYCSRRLTREREDRWRVIVGAVGGFGFEGLTAAREFLFGGGWRATAHLGQPNKLGDFLASYMMIPAAFLLSRVPGFFVASSAGIAVGLLGLMGAVSRGALLASAAGVCAMAIVRRSPWIVVIFAALATAPMWLPEKVMSRFETTVVEGSSGEVELDTEREGRIELWQMAALMIRDYPFAGVGLNMFPLHLRDYGYQARRLRSTHNIYIELAVEQGLPCAIAHIAMVMILAFIALKVALTHPDPVERGVGLGAFGMIIAIIIGSFFGDGFYENNFSGLFWVISGSVVNQSRELARARAGDSRPAPVRVPA